MLSLFEQLLGCLQQQKDLAAGMLEVCQQHLEALKKYRHEEIKQAVGQQEILIRQVGKIQKHCSAMQASLVKELGLPGDTALSALILHVPDTLGGKLQSTIEDLRDIFLKIHDVNETNKLLTRNGLALNDMFIRILLPTQSQTYQGDGAVTNKQPGLSRLNLTV